MSTYKKLTVEEMFDGQHRLEAARLAGIDKVPCLVHKQDAE